MEEKLKSNIYLNLFFSFLREEIPSIMQIITFLGFLSILLNNMILRLIISALLPYLLWQYLSSKMFLFLKLQIVDPNSEINRHKISFNTVLKKWEKYTINWAGISGIFIGMLPYILKVGF